MLTDSEHADELNLEAHNLSLMMDNILVINKMIGQVHLRLVGLRFHGLKVKKAMEDLNKASDELLQLTKLAHGRTMYIVKIREDISGSD